MYEKDDYCYSNIIYNEIIDEDAIYIGAPFIQTFSALFEYEDGKLLFAKNSKAKPGASIISPNNSDEISGWAKFGIFCLVTFLISAAIIVAFLIYRYK